MAGSMGRDLEFYRKLANTEGLYFNAISESQRQQLPELPWAGTVHKGIDVEAFPYSDKKQDFLLSIARIAPTKGQHYAVEAARALGKNLVIAGHVESSAEAQQYFDERIEPYVDRQFPRRSPDKLAQLQAILQVARGE